MKHRVFRSASSRAVPLHCFHAQFNLALKRSEKNWLRTFDTYFNTESGPYFPEAAELFVLKTIHFNRVPLRLPV